MTETQKVNGTASVQQPQPVSLLDQITAEQVDRDARRFDLTQRKASIAAESRLYKDAPTMEAAAVKMMMAQTLDIPEVIGLTDIRVVEGRPELSAGLTAALLQREGYSWKFVEHNATVCRAAFFHIGKPLLDFNGQPVVFAFTMEQARKAGYSERGHKDDKQNTYDKTPENMLYARMITNFTKFFAPHITRGMTIYSPGEISEVSAEQPLTDEQRSATAAIGSAGKADDLKAKLADRKAQAAAPAAPEQLPAKESK